MALEKSIINILKDRSIPEFIETEYPVFCDFMRAYFEFLENEAMPHNTAINLLDYRNIDKTIDDFIEYFKKEYLISIPKDIISDKRLLVKNIKNFYQNKGNEQSYKFLFRLLYNEDLDFYYPKTDVLRASDSVWYLQKSLKITLNNATTLKEITNKTITGSTSGAIATVENAIQITERGQSILMIDLSDITGTFVALENITFVDSTNIALTETILTLYNDVEITTAGSGYAVNDVINIKNFANQNIGFGTVENVTRGPVTGLTIDTAGTGYRGQFRQIVNFAYLPINTTWNGIYLPDAPIQAQATNDYDFSIEQINFSISTVLLQDIGDNITISDSASSSGTGAFGVVSEVTQDGALVSVSLLDGGQLYESPSAVVVSNTGTGAALSALGGGGAVSSVKLSTFPITLDSDFDSFGATDVTLDFTQAGDGLAVGNILWGALAEFPGRYLSESGHLSSNKKLQDNYYYQDFSYVLQAQTDITYWGDIIRKAIHPAGLELFGEVSIQSIVNINNINITDTKTIEVIDTININSIAWTESTVTIYLLDSNGIEYLP